MFAAKKSAQFSTPWYDEPRAFAAASEGGERGQTGIYGRVVGGGGGDIYTLSTFSLIK